VVQNKLDRRAAHGAQPELGADQHRELSTICAIKHADYLLRRIRDEPDPLHAQATALKVEMCEIGLRMIRQLDWRDFETLVDLIFARGGWQRSSVLGKGQADVDLILTQPTIGETAWVQIKSGTSQAELDDYVGRFLRALY
jgi:hypothetical protein